MYFIVFYSVFSFFLLLKLINNYFLYLEADMAFFLMPIKIFYYFFNGHINV